MPACPTCQRTALLGFSVRGVPCLYCPRCQTTQGRDRHRGHRMFDIGGYAIDTTPGTKWLHVGLCVCEVTSGQKAAWSLTLGLN